jgi:hypothetical protein
MNSRGATRKTRVRSREALSMTQAEVLNTALERSRSACSSANETFRRGCRTVRKIDWKRWMSPTARL